MGRPRFLADNDVQDAIVLGARLREPQLEIVRVRDVGLEEHEDPDALAWAAEQGCIVVSNDNRTMIGAAADRLAAGLPMTGLISSRQALPIAR